MHRPSDQRPPARHTSRCNGEGGQAMVEFAMVIPILLMVMMAAIEFGDAYWKYQRLSAAVSEGARKAIVSRTDVNRTTTVTNAVKNASDLTAASVNVTVTSTWDAGSDVTVTATYPETIRIIGLSVWSGNLTSRRTMRVEQ